MIEMSCPICRGTKTEVVAKNLSFCDHCGHYWQSDLTAVVEYDENYAKKYDNMPHFQMSQVRADFIEKSFPTDQIRKVLDVGHANGAFVKEMISREYDAFGTDLHGIDFGVPEVNLMGPETFDLVTFFDSLEHFENVRQPLHKSNKFILVSVPNTPPRLEKYIESWRHYRPGEHLHYFNLRSLSYLMIEFGFELTGYSFIEDLVRKGTEFNGFKCPNILSATYEKK
jgi:SAM-dependent methyltransferase